MTPFFLVLHGPSARYHFLCVQRVCVCSPQTNTSYILELVFWDLSGQKGSKSINHQDWKLWFSHKLPNNIPFDYFVFLPADVSDSLLMQTVRGGALTCGNHATGRDHHTLLLTLAAIFNGIISVSMEHTSVSTPWHEPWWMIAVVSMPMWILFNWQQWNSSDRTCCIAPQEQGNLLL